MKLPIFLKEVDNLSASLTHGELERFIHEVARTLPEEKRNYFINILRSIGNLSEEAKFQDIVKDDGYTKLIKDIETIKNKLNEINEGVFCLDSIYNEEWDDWYNSDVDEILFTDPQGVLQYVNKAMELIHSCIDMEVYKEGFELAEILSVLEVSTEGDYNDFNGSPLNMHELSEYKLLMNDFEHFVRESLYLTYMGNALEDRADKLFCMMKNFECYEICIEDILQSGNDELPQFNEFLTLWISYLGVEKGIYAEKLLKEAQMLLQDEDILLENARKFVDVHPVLYEQLLSMKLVSYEDDKILEIGKEALNNINCSYIIRSDIALLTAEYAYKLNDYNEVERCWLEAFHSNSTIINYLRIRIRSRDWSQYVEDAKLIYERIYKETNNSYVYNRDAQRENSLHKKEYCVMLFFDEQFDRLLTIGMNEKKALGWSATFMKEGLALILLLLYKGMELTKGLKSMLSIAASVCGFKTTEYCRGTGNCIELNDNDMFWNLFNQWKDNTQISEIESKEWLDRIDKWISLRVSGIMDSNRRNYYGECASYIAAFGEVQESLGIASAKFRIMEKYRSDYSRRSAFHQELRAYGMKK